MKHKNLHPCAACGQAIPRGVPDLWGGGEICFCGLHLCVTCAHKPPHLSCLPLPHGSR
jgi:hypothetical protein